ncbi:MAG: Na/Pi cotransporter family protein [Bacteroidales bacterium]|nr:Na/Pi cotransporter family protein [Bacteroidales bacterium]MDD4829081.1 Na/Pi cotransporter family protein [Bacteroidales bacterium]
MNVVFQILTLLGGLGLFLYGMKIMSDSLQRITGDNLRNILSKMTANRFRGILTGLGITSIIQSSSATTVMVVSFVNAGALTLAGAVTVIMGANIGTTVTAWIVSLLGFKFDISELVLPIIAIATPFLFIKSKENLGEFLIGFALLFLGLQMLTNNVPDFTDPKYVGVLEFIANMKEYGYFSTLLFVVVGTVFTFIIQSSSAMMAVTLVMCAKGLIPFEMGAALVLGENIGTTITANIAASVANKTAKQAARAHLIFNLIGVIWILILFNPVLRLIDNFSISFGGGSPLNNSSAIPVALSIFHSFFNISNSFILVWFVPQIIKIVERMVPIKKDDDEEFRLKFIPSGYMSAGELAIEPAKKEIETFSKRILKMYDMIPDLIKTREDKKYKEIYERIIKYEEITDRMEVEIANYLTKASEHDLSHKASLYISSMLRIVDNLESIGDSCNQIAITIDNKRKTGSWFEQDLRDKLNIMFEYVREALILMDENLQTNYSEITAEKANELEYKINKYRDQLRDEHTEAIKNNAYPYQTGIYYSSLYAQYEKLADFAINVTEAVEKVHE